MDRIVESVLYEGYLLYPYRRSTKNAHRWTIGGIFPRGCSGEVCEARTQMLVCGEAGTQVSVRLRFLQAFDRDDQEDSANGNWQSALERTFPVDSVELSELTSAPARRHFSFPPLVGSIEIAAQRLRDDFFRLTIRVSNDAAVDGLRISREEVSKHSLLSAHVLATVAAGQFISLIDPPAECAALARSCRNNRLWPVLVGDPGETDTMLAAPIILYDYPQVAPESPGDLFDGTEIDEILSLRILTLTDEEKCEAAALDDRAARLIARTQSLSRQQLARLHGTMRPPRQVEAIHVEGAELRVGDRVRLQPRQHGADAFDIILRGKTATIAAIEQDYENRLHLAVTIDDDPGADIGAAGKIGHRFFFRPDEVEPLSGAAEVTR